MVSETLVWFVAMTVLSGAPVGGPVCEAPPANAASGSDAWPDRGCDLALPSTLPPLSAGANVERSTVVPLCRTCADRHEETSGASLAVAEDATEDGIGHAADLQPVTEPRVVATAATTVALRLENDLIGGTDEGYSNGMSLTVSREGQGPLGWVWRSMGVSEGRWVTSYEVTQLLFTPRDLSRAVPDPTDVAYSGILVGGVATELAAGDRLYGLKVVAGVRGPAACGELVQKAVHRLTGSRAPKGWAHQLPNQLVLNATVEHRRRFDLLRSDAGWAIQAIPRVAGSVGNGLMEAQLGGQVRVGMHLPDDFGVTDTRGMNSVPFPRRHGPSPEVTHGVYGFLGAGGHAVGRNIVLETASSTDGADLAKTAAVGTLQAGVVLWAGRFEASLVYVVRGREFDTQPHPSRVGSATLAYHF
jgi:hypothetical protein